jgi:hypothetical protein
MVYNYDIDAYEWIRPWSGVDSDSFDLIETEIILTLKGSIYPEYIYSWCSSAEQLELAVNDLLWKPSRYHTAQMEDVQAEGSTSIQISIKDFAARSNMLQLKR